MIKIIKIEHFKDYILRIKFDEGTEKTLDFATLTSFDGIAEQLKDPKYFGNVTILRSGRSFGWDNGYDCCADWAYSV